MPATIVWGRGFRLTETTSTSGESVWEVFGASGGHQPMSWSSISEMLDAAGDAGVDREIWPIFADCEAERELPLEEAVRRSAAVLSSLEKVSPEAIAADHWLTFVWTLLRRGDSFLIMP